MFKNVVYMYILSRILSFKNFGVLFKDIGVQVIFVFYF